MGLFVRVAVEAGQLSAAQGRALVALCPVDIFAMAGERLTVRPEEEDECTLCELCLKAAPAGVIVIHKLYNDERLVSSGAGEGAQT